MEVEEEGEQKSSRVVLHQCWCWRLDLLVHLSSSDILYLGTVWNQYHSAVQDLSRTSLSSIYSYPSNIIINVVMLTKRIRTGQVEPIDLSCALLNSESVIRVARHLLTSPYLKIIPQIV